MTDANAHTFNPKDDSLEAKATSYRRVLRDARNAEKSLKMADSPAWSARLGSREEIQSASKVAQNSLEKAARDFNSKELETAIERGLLKQDELKEISIQNRRREIQAAREKVNQGRERKGPSLSR